jgi:hypothetical protein
VGVCSSEKSFVIRHHPWRGFGLEQALAGLSNSPQPEMTNRSYRRRLLFTHPAAICTHDAPMSALP